MDFARIDAHLDRIEQLLASLADHIAWFEQEAAAEAAAAPAPAFITLVAR